MLVLTGGPGRSSGTTRQPSSADSHPLLLTMIQDDLRDVNGESHHPIRNMRMKNKNNE